MLLFREEIKTVPSLLGRAEPRRSPACPCSVSLVIVSLAESKRSHVVHGGERLWAKMAAPSAQRTRAA